MAPVPESSVDVRIAGVSVRPALKRQSLSWERPLNGRGTATLTVLYPQPGGSRPRIRDEVEIIVDGVRRFGGLVQRATRRPIVGKRGEAYVLQCAGWEAYADGVFINGIIPSASLKTLFSTAGANLAPFGIGVDPTMPTGPVLETLTLPFQSIRQAWDAISTQSGWPWSISPDKFASARPPGTVPAPFTLGVGGDRVAIDGAQTETDVSGYVNRLWVIFGEPGERDVTEQRPGNGTRQYRLDYWTLVGPTTVNVNGTVQVVGPGATWSYADGVITQAATEPLLGAGDVITITYRGRFPSSVMVEDTDEVALYREVSGREDLPDEYDVAAARAWGRGRLAARGGLPRTATLTAWRPGLEPGMSVGVNLPQLDMSGDWLVVRVGAAHLMKVRRDPPRHAFAYRLDLVEGARYRDGWERYFRDLQERRGAGGSGVASGSGGGTPPAAPLIGLTRTTLPLGGSLLAGQRATSWVRVSMFGAVIDWPTLTPGSAVRARVACRTALATTSITVRIWNEEDGLAVALSPASTSTTPVEQPLDLPRAGGRRTYYLEVLGSNGNALVFAEGIVDVVLA